MIPYNIAPRFSQFLRRDVNKAFAEVTGEKVSRVWTGDSMCVPSLWTKSVHRQDEGINRFSESWWTRIAS